jgi:hypothetical protein
MAELQKQAIAENKPMKSSPKEKRFGANPKFFFSY